MPGLSHSPTFQPDQRLSGSRSITAQLFCLLQASANSPISLVVTQLASTISVGEHRPCESPTFSLLPIATSSIQVHLGNVRSILPFWQGRELLIWLSSKTPVAVPAGARPGLPPAPYSGPRDLTIPKQSPYHMFFSVL